MKCFSTILLSFFAMAVCFAAPPAPMVRTNAPNITTLPNFPLAHLRANISPKLYRSLAISPVTAWIVTQVPMNGGAPRIVRSDAGGAFDKFALEVAKNWQLVGYNTTESRTHTPTLNVHLLIYKIADGLMIVNFSHNDEAFYAGPFQYTDVAVAVWSKGKWTNIGGTKWTRRLPEPTG